MQRRYTRWLDADFDWREECDADHSLGGHVKSTNIAIVFAALSAAASAEQRTAIFDVAVTVPVRVELDVVEQPVDLVFTSQDVARGYKDVAVRYRVRHNDRRGYVLELSTFAGVARQIEVYGLGAEWVLREPLAIPRPGTPFEQEIALDLRVVLDPAAPPGTFALPLHVVARPI